jgi:CO/xanthine dehydrogenase FAD-binding subunit/aerobic-type carbon monoxide dehydrogenase small subunit (CoxS/CutS family)
VKPAPFEYRAPSSIAEALTWLSEAEDAVALAGGQSLVPLLNLRFARPSLVVDLNPLAELAYLDADAGALRIGALTRQAALERAPAVAEGWPLLADAVACVGHPATRTRGTIGGSVAHADPRAELPVALIALGARFRLRSPGGERVVNAGEMFLGPMRTAIADGELLSEIEVPAAPAGARMAFCEHARTHGDFALAGAGVVIAPGEHASIALLGGGPRPVRSAQAEAALLAGADDRRVAQLAAAGAGDAHRRALLEAVVARALALARIRGPGGAGPRHRPAGWISERPDGISERAGGISERAGGISERAGGISEPAIAIEVKINGRGYSGEVEGRTLLSDFIRHQAGLTGTHVGCEHGVCGACTVQLDGEPVRSCLMLAVQAAGRSITTVEGLAGPDGELSELQRAFSAHHALQCGFCTSGFLISADALLRARGDRAGELTESEVRAELAGNLCRCTGYQGIVAAVLSVARRRAAGPDSG